MITADNSSNIRLKLLSRKNPNLWLQQIPRGAPPFEGVEFILDPKATEYDWLAVYDELPRENDPVEHSGIEKLCCHPDNTILITSEPSTIKFYSRSYTEQFRWVLTSQEGWALSHPGRIHSQPALRWFYGADNDFTFEDISRSTEGRKTNLLSTVCSAKQQKHTLHNKRYNFTRELKLHLPELDIYGRGVKSISDKSEALIAYKYHVAIENFIGLHHWTEKVSDAFLGGCLPFYAGCPNLAEYFPEKSFIPINLYDVEESVGIIREAIQNNEYEKRVEYIQKAKNLVLTKYNLFATLAEITKNKFVNASSTRTGYVISRRKLRNKPWVAMEDFTGKLRLRLRHMFNTK